MKRKTVKPFDPIRLRQIREFKKVSQQEVASYLNISQSSYNDLEQGKTKLKVDCLLLFASYFDLDCHTILNVDCEPASQNNSSKLELTEAEKTYHDLHKKQEENMKYIWKTVKMYHWEKRFYLLLLISLSILTFYLLAN